MEPAQLFHSSSPALAWTPSGHYFCGTACSHGDVRWTHTLVSGMSCVSQCVCARVSECAYIHEHAYACTVYVLGGIGACCMLILLEGYVNVLREECEYITPSHQQSSPPRSPSSPFTFSPCSSLCPPLTFLSLCRKHSSSMKSLKAKPSNPGIESVLNISWSGTLRPQFHEYRGQLACTLTRTVRKIIRRGSFWNIITEELFKAACVNADIMQ